MQTTTVFQTDDDGYFLYPLEANPLPFAADHYNVPFRAVSTPPPDAPAGKCARWQSAFAATLSEFNIGAWTLEDIASEQPEPQEAEAGTANNPQPTH